MTLELYNKVKITSPTNEVLQYCSTSLIFDNPDYLKKEAMGKWTGNTQRKIILYERAGDVLYLPFGTFAEIYKQFKTDFEHVECRICGIRARNYNSRINLYDYQQNAVERVIRAKNGILVAPCGSGKTQMGLEIVAQLGGRALWITHTQDLLKQSMERAAVNFDLCAAEYGTITAGKVNIGNTITFATVQTLSNIDLAQYRDEWDIIIVDECHKCVGTPTQMTMFYKVLSQLSARYKIGLTATPYRADGLEKAMFAILGGVIHEVPKSAVKDKTCPVKVKFVETSFTPDYNIILAGDGTLIYSQLIDNICRDTARNGAVTDEIIKQCNGATLILSERVAHLTELQRIINDKAPNIKTMRLSASNTKLEKQYRAHALDKMRSGECDILFATYKLAKEGLDIPNLRYVVFASPIKDKTTVTQSAGRVGRKCDGKAYGTVIDFVDGFGMLRGYAKKRAAIYKKLEYEVIK